MDHPNPLINIRCVNCTCMSVAFHTLDEQQLELVDAHRSELNYRKGEILCKQGSFVSNMMFIKEGLVKLYIEGADHRQTIISMETSGHFVGLSAILSEGSPVYQFTVEALTDTDVCLVDLRTFESLVYQNTHFTVELIKIQNKLLIKHYRHLLSLSQKQIKGRFSELLLDLSERIYKEDKMNLTISRKDMAEFIGSTQESVSRLLGEFKTDGLININNHRLEILDKSRLQKISRLG